MQTKAEYDLIADKWCDVRKTLPEADSELFDLFLDCLPANSRILDLGCGHGIPIGELMSSNGHSVLGVDRSIKLLSMAQKNMPQHDWIQSNIESFKPTEQFDGVIIWDSMFHLPRNEHVPLIKKAFDALNYKGVIILSSGGSKYDIPAFTGSMFDETFFYDSFTIDRLIQECENIGLRVIQSKLVNEPDGGRDKGRLGVVLKKL